MKVFTQTDTNISSKRLKERFRDILGSAVWVEEERDFSNTPWEDYNDEHKGITKAWLHKQLDRINRFHQNTIDVYFSIIQASNWQGGSVVGWHLAKAYRGARICLVKNRKDWLKTAEHELVHAIWAYVYYHTGIKLEHVFGLSENDIAHGLADGWEEYEYDRFWEKVRSYYQLARGEDLSDEYRNLLEMTVRKAKQVIRKLRM